MRKLLFGVLVLSLTLAWGAALAQTHVFDALQATVEIPDSYIVLTGENLPQNADWLESRGLSIEEVSNDFIKRGVLLQCWTVDYDACMELTALQTDQAQNIFDVNEQEDSVRGGYRLSHYPDNDFLDQGYDFSSADWKNTPEGRFLILRYVRRGGGEILHRGLMRRTIRNGYEITFDMQIYGRSPSNKDNTALNKIWNSFHFAEVLPLPPAASAKINITKEPPAETNSSEFTIEGTAAKDVKLTAVIMGLSSPAPTLVEAQAGSSGKFKMPVQLPKEGVFMITITGEYMGEDVKELAFPVTYQRTLLTVNLTTPLPEAVTTSELTLLGTSEPGASIQVFINNEPIMTKRVTAAGKFKVDLDTSTEGPYDLVLVFSKKGLADRRITHSFTRQWSEADILKDIKRQAIKPGYAALKKKIEAYEGRIMGYKCYLLNVTKAGDEYIAQMALTKRGEEYSSVILVTCDEEPTMAMGTQVWMYGTCVGMSLPSEGDETNATYPCFELLMFASVE